MDDTKVEKAGIVDPDVDCFGEVTKVEGIEIGKGDKEDALSTSFC